MLLPFFRTIAIWERMTQTVLLFSVRTNVQQIGILETIQM